MADSSLSPVDGAPLRHLQRRRKYMLASGIAVGLAPLLVTESIWRMQEPHLYWFIVTVGLALIVLCIAGRTWCTLYIGGHKKRRLVRSGPYSIVRNPLYVFSVLGTAGIGALTGSLVLAAFCAFFAWMVFSYVVRREEGFLAAQFGAEFTAYAAEVPRFWPSFGQWQEADELLVNPRLVRRTFLDASLFLLAIPLMGLKVALQQAGTLPILLHLP